MVVFSYVCHFTSPPSLPAIKLPRGLQLVLSIQNHVLLIVVTFWLDWKKDIKYYQLSSLPTTQTDIQIQRTSSFSPFKLAFLCSRLDNTTKVPNAMATSPPLQLSQIPFPLNPVSTSTHPQIY